MEKEGDVNEENDNEGGGGEEEEKCKERKRRIRKSFLKKEGKRQKRV